MSLLSVIVPVYNEEKTILELLQKLKSLKFDFDLEFIFVDDGSVDSSGELIKNFILINRDFNGKYYKKENGGKGSAIRFGLSFCNGEVVIVQDGDLEYNPEEYSSIVLPIFEKKELVVYGSRRLKNNPKGSFFYFFGGNLVTFFINLFYGSKLTDEPTCYKAFDIKFLRSFEILSKGFEWEPEITSKILLSGVNILEVPISYSPRDKSQGKKINFLDGFKAIYILIKIRFLWFFRKHF